MTKVLLAVSVVATLGAAEAGAEGDKPAQTKAGKTAPRPAIEAFQHDRFGLFLHWGCYSQLGKGEWNMFFERAPAAEYAKLASTFDPQSFDARQWARVAKAAGMKYMVLTTRHHDGFCLFDSKVSDFTSVKCSPQHRDYVREFVEACREYGLKVGFYYSQLDWRFHGYFHYKTDMESADALRRQCHGQVMELMTNYGKIDILWYDGLWLAHDPKTDTTDSPVFWEGAKLNARVRELQPGIVINNRISTPEDFSTPEGKIDVPKDKNRPWEYCNTMTSGWGFYGGDEESAKSPYFVLYNLIDAVSQGGNFLCNVGVNPQGLIPAASVDTLNRVGEWMKVNGESNHRLCVNGLPLKPPVPPFMTLKFEFEKKPEKIKETPERLGDWLTGQM